MQDFAAIQAEQAALDRETLELMVCPLSQPSLLLAAERYGFRLIEFKHVLFGGQTARRVGSAPDRSRKVSD